MRTSLAATRKAALSETMVNLAAAQCGAGKRGAAVRTLREVFVWRPQVETTLADAPSGWGDLVEQARAQVAAAGVGAIRITSVPRQAEAYVDGHRVGPTPVLATNLTIGTHYLTLHLEGYQAIAMPVTVEPGTPRTVSAALHATMEGASLAGPLNMLQSSLGTASIPELRDVLKDIDARLALFVVVNVAPGGLELEGWLYELENGRLEGQAVLTTASPPRTDQLAGLGLWAPVPGEPRPRHHQTGSGAWYRRWWVLTLAGAALTLVIAVPLSVIQHGTPQEQFELRW
jgi:hypothetical protein